MPEITEKTTFKASDGCEFKSREEAERYEAMREANDQFETAVRLYNVAIAKTLKTADGYPFQLGDAYYIVCEQVENDYIDHRRLHARQTRVSLYDNGAKVVFIGCDTIIEFEIENIYAKERNAKLQLLELRRRRLGWLEEDIAKLERNLGIEQEKK